MSENVIQASFASGELSPSLFARVDVSKYHSGAARMRNFFVDYRSGASTRTGFEFIRPCVQNQGPVRLVRFQQSVGVTYVLEFSQNKLRFIANGGSVVYPPAAITSLVPGTRTVITAPGTVYPNGGLVFIYGSSIPQLNNRYFIVDGFVGGTFAILDPITNTNIDSTSWPPWVGGASQLVYEIFTPYNATDLALLKFSQKASKLNITHNSYAPATLTLISATNWVLATYAIGTTASPPTVLNATGSATGPANYLYAVTSLDVNGQESAPIKAYANGVMDMRVINASANTSGSVSLQWNTAANAVAYNVYATSPNISGPPAIDTMVGFIGTTTGLNFTDANTTPDFQTQPPTAQNPFATENPACSSYFQQRLCFANGGGNDLDRFWMSQPGTDYNFDNSNPSQADDAIDARLVSLEVNEIKSMIPMPSGLIMLTTKGAWQVSGGAGGVATQGGPVTPTSLTATPQAYIGANDVPPILINYDIFYVQQKGSIIRDLTYNIYANIYTGADVSVMSSHLFYGHQIREWAYAEEPFKIVWAVRNDGVLLSLTVLKEQEMMGWARHDTLGYFRSVCTVTESMVDATYVVVERPMPGTTQTMLLVERMHERSFNFGAEDAFSVDSAIATVPNMPNATLSIMVDSVGNFIFDTNNSVFVSQGGWILRVGGGKFRVTQINSGFECVATQIQPITNILTDDPLNRFAIAPPGTWSLDPEIQVLHGLNHLEGNQVSVLADGGVVNDLVVTSGSVTLPQPASRIVVGLGYQCQLQTMYLDLGQEANTIQGKRKKVGALTVRVKDSRGLKAGRTFNLVTPIKELNRTTMMGTPIPLITADERIIMDPLWDVPGQICLQVDDPLPVTVLGVIPEVVIGDSAK